MRKDSYMREFEAFLCGLRKLLYETVEIVKLHLGYFGAIYGLGGILKNHVYSSKTTNWRSVANIGFRPPRRWCAVAS
jgi:hypothetical protein